VSRWLEETGGTSGEDYAARFAALAASGRDLHGEARYVDALLPRNGRVLDAGCGTGRVAVELAARGHRVTGVDSDASMLEVARRSPGVRWELGDLASIDLDETYDVVVMAGNVIVFVEPGTEQQVVDRCAAHLAPGGLLVSGWRTDRLARTSYDVLVAGLEPVARHATWDGDPWRDDADWCVAVDLQPARP
jgi:2-polyprenyl-3-methyl-5-hydroxy-6-metoxy-1,4-benzoquinol methylase